MQSARALLRPGIGVPTGEPWQDRQLAIEGINISPAEVL